MRISSTTNGKLISDNTCISDRFSSTSSTVYYLDIQCKSNLIDSSTVNRTQEFNSIFDTRKWNQNEKESRSGPGSTLEGAFDWIKHLRSLMQHFHIRSIADIPCGDTFWQFSIQEINTIEQLYFGGDISTHAIQYNQKLYGTKHHNKLFHYWDLVNCPIPTFSYRNSTHKIQNNSFDLIIVRDALQHMHIRNGLKAVRNVIRSGGKYFALSSYPPNGKSSASNSRSIDKNEPLPKQPLDCATKNYCKLGAIKEGDVYGNNINCYPFNFPLNKAILVQPSHEKFQIEYDEIHIYKIDDELKQIVEQYDNACI
ncbi:unnamed protein product [Rotaria sordida]|uniref:Methyltransferase type 11 domain-containing protein n=1 Tax=Rotaria sordida TaxID=392033 RepID=A0A819X3K0_9BILA|nr:unnamed protein product [Rotaria sordida]CAF0859641.1 unnamed protein product [Rotaria sordida]CAF3478207.1 unnamed protein product [Rotaria sordida]CAF4134609.1 unnamed protein product [Rotaria sordida]